MNEVPYEERLKVYRQAIRAYGKEAQIHMALEEMSELTKELCKSFRPGGTTPEKIADEVADVTIMMEQLRIIFDLNGLVCQHMDMKVERLAGRLGMDVQRRSNEILLDDCGLSTRALNTLKRAGYRTMRELVETMTWKSRFLTMKGCGYIIAQEIIEKAHEQGFTFAWENEAEADRSHTAIKQ